MAGSNPVSIPCDPVSLLACVDYAWLTRIDDERALAQAAVDRARFALSGLQEALTSSQQRARKHGRTDKHIHDIASEHAGAIAWASEDLRQAVKWQAFVEARYKEAITRENS